MKNSIMSLALLLTLGTSPQSFRAQQKTVEGYEMTTYYVALLYRGPKWTPEVTEETKRIQEGHMANIRKMAGSGKLVLAGPFSDDGTLRGMFVFQVGSIEEAKALTDDDPAVQAGRLAVEIHPWLSAKGIRVDPPKRR
jgi:uncharacterized protein YciI